MAYRYYLLLATVILVWLASATFAHQPPAPLGPDQLAARIDQVILAKLTAAKVEPAPIADDAEFLRRVSLDLAGRIPRAFEVRDFLDDNTPGKRQRLVERLLERSAYVNHFANVWRDLLLPQVNNPQVRALIPSFEDWLRPRIRENIPYDQLIRELLTASPSMPRPQMRERNRNREPTPAAFYQANELKPENLAGNTSRLLLGVKLECAQCHDHPHAHWVRKQFWEYAAFFADVPSQRPGQQTLKFPGTNNVIEARFLDGAEPKSDAYRTLRAALAEWMTAPSNPYFARAAANRLWAHFFGVGIVEPVDDLGENNLPSHPELLDELARQFVVNRFDVKFMIRAITSSQAYQRTSAVADPQHADPRSFAQMNVRGMSPEQLFDSLLQAIGVRDNGELSSLSMVDFSSARAQFVGRFTNQERRTEHQTSILQALTLMNGKVVEGATDLEQSQTLAAVADAPFLDTPQKIEALFMTTLSRRPTAEEAERLAAHVSGGGAKANSKAALGDVFWALLNSAEFMLNH
jgi:hypothetical protein